MYADIPDCAANSHCSDFLDPFDSMVVDEETMAGAIAIGRYFTH